MKRLIVLLLCAVYTVLMTFVQDMKEKRDSATFFVEAMGYDHRIEKVGKNITSKKGMTGLKYDLSTRMTITTYKADKTSKIRLATVFRKIGTGAVPVDNGTDCPVPPARKSEHTHVR